MRSIFWKIFLAFWLANTVIIVAGNVIVNHELTKKFLEVKVEQRMNRVVRRIIAHRESGTKAARHDEHPHHFPLHDRLQITELSHDERIFGPAHFPSRIKLYEWIFTSDNGNQYRITVPRPPGSLLPDLNRIGFARLLLVLLVTGLFSYLLTVLITRPLKRLETHIDRLGAGEFDARLDQKLLARRDEFGALAGRVNHMADRIHELLEARQQLLHDVSHELRAPLARLQVANELARQKIRQQNPADREFDRVDQECENLSRLIDEILTLSRLSFDRDHKETESCRLDILLQQVVDDALYRYRDRDIQVSCHGLLTSAIPIKTALLERALKNVIENALQHTPAGTPIRIDLEQTTDGATFVIEDQGPGIPEEDLNKIFAPFFRSKNSPGSGYGLGLHIARKAVEALRGTIAAQSAAGSGLTIIIQLPVPARL